MVGRVPDDNDLGLADIDFDDIDAAEQEIASGQGQRAVLECADLLAALAGNTDALELDPQHRPEAMPFDLRLGEAHGETQLRVIDRLFEIRLDDMRLDRRGRKAPDRDRGDHQDAADRNADDFEQ